MKKLLSYSLSLTLLSSLSACYTTGPFISPNKFNFPYKQEISEQEKDVMAKEFIKMFEQTLIEVNGKYLENKENPTLRAGLFDRSSRFNKEKFADINKYEDLAFLRIAYKPMSMYGNDFKNITPYCQIFYDWENRDNIAYYYQKLFFTSPVTIVNGISFRDIASYLAVTSFGYCREMNLVKQGKKQEISNKELFFLP